ncbi:MULTISPECIES: hypothetical protein [Paenibacillus]|uniref:Uncharacterized protein n=1 Tax=Paenibacillus vandeheii TaxID=3035917 RepID=A0ABT8J4N7_9BACL|nr:MULTISPECIES: hypothetical protein [Paenibacillus]MDN4600056.1 hypothetical protein [Paenibacillus vandeheii]SLJ92624.1 hypothetical protein SAMN06272722_1011097 [Paenibacillus sp. RU5A]SOC58551.1 hypothetical protein SAMN05880581_10193 [Paenibacillus sp. RU26A]SOC67603.1 hypothetical protein SAMN05880586_10193 [Paenibacillus sp. RU5M]
MIEEWIKIAADIKQEEMVDICEEATDTTYKELIKNLEEIKRSHPELILVTDKIENLFIKKTREDVAAIFYKTLVDGIEIGKNIR